ncbi:hypothetical protein [Ralstonia pickettii]|nr:hypothetical protein [Ralstonia pickettii]
MIRITSTIDGYTARVMEEVSGGQVVPVALNLPPRLEIDPAEFYRNRAKYRSALVLQVNDELLVWRVTGLTPEQAGEDNDAYIRANLAGWEGGYPFASMDEMDEWNIREL